MGFVLPLIGIGLGVFFAVRKFKKKKRREKLIDEFLEKHVNNDKQNKID